MRGQGVPSRCNPSQMFQSAEAQAACAQIGANASDENPNADSTYVPNVDSVTPVDIIFTGAIKAVSVCDLGGSPVEATLVLTNFGTGNQIIYAPSNGCVNFELTTETEDLIFSVSLIRVTAATSGPVIVNAMSPGKI